MIEPLLKNGKTIPLGELVEEDRPITYGILKPGTGYPGGIPVVKVKDMRNGEIDLSDLLLTTPELDYQYRRLSLAVSCVIFAFSRLAGTSAIRPTVPRMEISKSPVRNLNLLYW